MASFEVNCFHSLSIAFSLNLSFSLVEIAPAGKITITPSLRRTSRASFLALILSFIASFVGCNPSKISTAEFL